MKSAVKKNFRNLVYTEFSTTFAPSRNKEAIRQWPGNGLLAGPKSQRHVGNGMTHPRIFHSRRIVAMDSKNRMEYQTMWRRLVPLYEAREAQAIVRTLLDEGYGLSMADVLTGGVERLTQGATERLAKQMESLSLGVPLQQVLGYAWFCDRRYAVSPHVLTPRPETEEMCRWIVENMRQTGEQHLLDIGTGSGCIACTLALDLPQAKVTAVDISDKALQVASSNAESLGAKVRFLRKDILEPAIGSDSDLRQQRYDIIVSNPPYITNGERAQMHRNVLEHEPHTALFVPDEDPLLYYRAIARLALDALKPGAWLYFEINPLFCQPLCQMLHDLGYANTTLKADEQGKIRMARAQLFAT